MKIRSVTVNLDPSVHDMDVVGDMLQESKTLLPFEVQTVRASVTPVNNKYDNIEDALEEAMHLEEWARSSSIDYLGGFGLGRYPEHREVEFLRWIPNIFDKTEKIFSNCQISWGKKVSFLAIRECARLVKELSMRDEGFTNLRFAGLYNCQPNNPYFPTSYASGDVMNFSIALEGADIATNAFKGAESLPDARNRFIQLLRDSYCDILVACLSLEESYGISFYGIDFTLAPTPQREGSIANSLETLGLKKFGRSGTLFLSSFLSDCVKSLGGKIGFSGLMYPLLEDGVISERASEREISIDSLLSYSSVCGTGLDCVPLPGDISEGTLAAIMSDAAGLSCRLLKPLTTRLLPVPGKKAGDVTDFDFPYFSNSRVLDVKDSRLGEWLDSEFTFNV